VLSDADFASLLCAALLRSLPLQSLRQHPLLAALLATRSSASSLLAVAAQLRRHNGTGPALHEETYREGPRLFGQGRFEEASELIMAALQQSPNSDRWSDWANARLAGNHHAEAELGYRRALELDRDHSHAALRLGYLLAASGHHSDAVFHLERNLHTLTESERPAVSDLIRQCRTRLSLGDSPLAKISKSS
jgi:Flp pilus assembly protein TadD